MLHRVASSGSSTSASAADSDPSPLSAFRVLDVPGALSRASAARRLTPDEEGNPALNRLAELAARLLGAESAQVSLVSTVQHVAAATGHVAGTAGTEGPVEDSLCTVTVASGAPLVVADATNDARVSDLPPVRLGVVGAYLGVPLTADDGHTIGALCVFDPEARTWSDNDTSLLQQLAAPVVAELELAALTADYDASRAVWQMAIDAAGVGAFEWDLVTGELRWDDRLLDLFGFDRSDFNGTIEGFNEALHPDDLPRVTQALQTAIETCGDFAAEYRIVQPDGHVRWISARGRTVCDDGVATRLIGAAHDSTAVQDGDARVARILEAMPTAFYSIDADWRFSHVNAEAERLLGSAREELVGGILWDLFPAAVGSEFEVHFRGAVESGVPVSFDAFYPEPLNGWFEVRAWPSPEGLSVYFVDITARKRAQEELELAATRSALLARLTTELTESLDASKGVGRLAEMVVPELADWCVVTLVDDDVHPDWRRRLRDVGSWHADPALRDLVARYAETRVPALTDDALLARALRTGEPGVALYDAAELLASVLVPGEARDICLELDPAAVTVYPLKGRGRIVGLLTANRGRDRAPFTPADLDLLGEVASRAGLALDNARLFEQQRDLAEGLQRALLTEPPKPDRLEVAVLYEPAAQVAQVGGDWYDSFLQRDGATVVVIGDVVGHDTAAAAAMGQARSLLRAIAVHTGDGPADVLRGVDRAMETLGADTTATAVVARLEQNEDEESRDVTRFRWSNAGHPPPMVIKPDGDVVELSAVESDLLLGLDPDARRIESVVTLDRGATVLLYTDGLVERRGQSLDAGLRALRSTLMDVADEELSLDELCQAVLARMLPGRRDDDVALVAVRLR
jgi:PAS domain S-box-containing protein